MIPVLFLIRLVPDQKKNRERKAAFKNNEDYQL